MHVTLASLEDMATFSRWAANEGWEPGQGDSEPFHGADPQGFHLGDINGETAALISAVRYDTYFAFIGFYIVRRDLRGRGLGHQIWDHGLATVEDRVLGLDGVLEQEDSYSQAGFERSHLTTRYSGSIHQVRHSLAHARMDRVCEVEQSQIDSESLIDFDALHVPDRRSSFIRGWTVREPTRQTAVALDGGLFLGYATVRQVPGGSRVGPLFAADDEVAGELMRWCVEVAHTWGDTFQLDVPDFNPGARGIVERLDMAPGFSCVRMYRGTPRSIQTSGVYANTTFELG